MKMTKVVPFAMSALLIGGAVVAPSASANEGEAVVTNATDNNEQNPQVQPIFIKVAGTVDNVEKRDDATYYTVKEGENTNVFVVNDDTLVFDNTGKEVKLQKGYKVTAYTYANKPMLMIYPPQYNPEVIIVESEEMGTVEVDFFNKELVNTDNTLKLNVGEETELLSLSGKEVKAEDLAEQHLLVFYTIATMSIPAQTPPTKVVVLDTVAQEPGEVDPGEVNPSESAIQEIINKDFYEVEGTKMVPLRLIAEELGFKVESTGKGAIISKGALSYTITRGQKEYGYNKAIRHFKVAPALLEPSKTYVPVEFVEELMK
ncbi:copper amine oxidase N-terminal domain-containing protein [Lysinibacillus agricola]|uniref:Copper amine oxidase N-terminal domain-containing protein n=1 Tax=Lysinibacillus agricola TaxID=2590012 RepID=A0ABX7B203_9BACI|nr:MULTISPECIES: stalk domain-containing protein [Lysinibacillus]KOS60144.1 copper amine oxidase [Lysinibacillus sp. FJAT-14222]QQP14434.1 copper amine oxidase N-terminal domain-containing protein [Lysinibacillus agricola]